jgi:CubicO group peptidase (beta-lactamase class C family)
MKSKLKLFFIWIVVLVFIVSCQHRDDQQPLEMGPEISGSWPAWESYEAAGWSPEGIAQAKSYWQNLASAAVVVVYQNRVLIAWGSVQQNFWTHSVRKSFMSAVYGIYVDRGMINLEKTLAELGIDDEPPLTEAEKRAKIIDLLQARSGVYHTAAAETESMHDYKPDRGSYGPGEFWCYNNWDFNVLATIFDQETDTDFFSALYQDLNQQLGMEDYQPEENQYSYQLDRSIHPAYGFTISARDSARFGQLYLQEGRWGSQQIISSSWISISTAPVSDSSSYFPGTFYGYMWWIFPAGYGADAGLNHVSRYQSYAALGAYGQVIQVIPALDLVFVHRVNSFIGNQVTFNNIFKLLNRILAARN